MARTCLRAQHIFGWICAFSPDDFSFHRRADSALRFRDSFGQPRMEALKRLEDSGARVYRNDVTGSVTF